MQDAVHRTWVETMDLEQVDDRTETLGLKELARGKEVEPRWTGAASKRWREGLEKGESRPGAGGRDHMRLRGMRRDLSSSPLRKRQRMEGEKMETITRDEERDKTMVEGEQMVQGTPEGAANPRGKRWRKARHAKGEGKDTKGTKKNVYNFVEPKEWTGDTSSKRKRIWREAEENDTLGAKDGRTIEQEMEDVQIRNL